jgi:predicted Fe-S protein YdhL (DUF1289 family)
MRWIRWGAYLEGGTDVTQPLADWSDLSDDHRRRVQQQTPERQAQWAEFRASDDSLADLLDLLRN